MCAIDLTTFRQSEAQLRPKWPQIEKVTPSASFAPSSSAGGVTLKVVLAQLQRMDARLDTLSDELRQVTLTTMMMIRVRMIALPMTT